LSSINLFFCPSPCSPVCYEVPRLTRGRCMGWSAVPSTCPGPRRGSPWQHPDDAGGENSLGFCARPDPAESMLWALRAPHATPAPVLSVPWCSLGVCAQPGLTHGSPGSSCPSKVRFQHQCWELDPWEYCYQRFR